MKCAVDCRIEILIYPKLLNYYHNFDMFNRVEMNFRRETASGAMLIKYQMSRVKSIKYSSAKISNIFRVMGIIEQDKS